jgi:hypothetical protein
MDINASPSLLLVTVMAVAVYLWVGNIWASIAGLAFVTGLGLWVFQCANMTLKGLQLEAREREAALSRHLVELAAVSLALGEFESSLMARLDSLAAMAEFVGEQSFPNFANAVKTFKKAQEDGRLRKEQQDLQERQFKDSLDTAVRNTLREREREAEAARQRFKRSHEIERKAEP